MMERAQAAAMFLAAGLLACPAAGLGNGLLVNGGFETNTPTTFSTWWPDAPGYWHGDDSATVLAQDGITPFEGSRMLHMRHSNSGPGDLGGVTTACDVVQLVDLSPHAGLIGTGSAVALSAARFNRVAGDSETDTLFRLRLWAYAGDPSTFPSQIHTGQLARAETLLYSDADSDTWEQATAELPLPVETDFLAVILSACENVHNDLGPDEFDGH